jgi:hypothetical protein
MAWKVGKFLRREHRPTMKCLRWAKVLRSPMRPRPQIRNDPPFDTSSSEKIERDLPISLLFKIPNIQTAARLLILCPY